MYEPSRQKITPPLVLFLLVSLLAVLCPLAAQAADTPQAAMQVEYPDQKNQNQTYHFTADERGVVTCEPEWPDETGKGAQGNYPVVSYDSAANTWQFGGADNQQYFNAALTITVPDDYPANVAMNGGNRRISAFGTLTVKGAVRNFTATANTTDTVIDYADVACTGSVVIENTGGGGAISTLTVQKAASVTLKNDSRNYATVDTLKVKECTQDVTITNTSGPAIGQSINGFIQSAQNVAITGSDSSSLLGSFSKISCTGTITLKNNGNGGLVEDADAYELLQTTGGTPAYYTTEGAAQYTLTAPTDTAINYLKIVPCTVYGITVTEGTNAVAVTSLNAGDVLGDQTMTYAGGKLKFESDAGNARTFNVAITGSDPVDVEFTSGEWNTLKDLTITGAHDVTATGANSSGVVTAGDLNITCNGSVNIPGRVGSSSIPGNLTVTGASSVRVTKSSGATTAGITGDATFEDCGEVHLIFTNDNIGGKLTVRGSSTQDVTVYANTMAGDVSITCNDRADISSRVGGDLIIANAKDARVGLFATMQGNIVFHQCQKVSASSGRRKLTNGTLTVDPPTDRAYRILVWDADDSYTALSSLRQQTGDYIYLLVTPAYTVTVQGGGTANTAEACEYEPVTLTAPASKNDQPFDKWEVVSGPSGWRFDGTATDASTTFTMPAGNVVLKARYTGDSGTDDDTPDTPAAATGGDGGAGAAVVLVGGAAVWGGYEVATRVILHKLLPEGAAIPKNRGQLALLLWNTAGRPEPASAPVFADVADADTAKAAQWCVEQGYLTAKTEGTFKPNGWMPKFKTIQVWNKAFPNV